MNVEQCRMARAALGWTLDDLAHASGVSRRTVARFEGGETVLGARVQRLRSAFEGHGILFIDTGAMAGGVVPRLRAGKPS
jgi:transcriptional regulator with XRE-family HTH domain